MFKLFKNRKPKKKKPVLDYRALSLIAFNNARYLRSVLRTRSAIINSFGKREAKKRKPELDYIEKKLAEEEFYASYYESKGVQQANQT